MILPARIIPLLLLLVLTARGSESLTNLSRLPMRVPLTGLRLAGSPEPPLPYQAKRVFAHRTFRHPLHVTHLPGSDRMLVVEQAERILSFPRGSDDTATNVFCFLRDFEIYSVIFHPGFNSNRFAYVFSNGPQSSAHKTNKIYRYVVPREAMRCEESSRQLIIEWESNGHNGGDLAFGPDGLLYLSSGDGTSDSDRNVTGQDITDLNAGILRIDVDHPDAGRHYSIPRDNPFLQLPGARGELWCYGMRNPWRIHFDPAGQLWVGDIGQDVWEMIILAERGGNYGWSVLEGAHPFRLQRQPGPTPFTPPAIELHHSEARSITGGLTYRGRKLAPLKGTYIFGDYGTGRIWSARARNGQLLGYELIADTPHQILGFGEDADGELFYADYGGGIYELEPTPPVTGTHTFPRRLSETGLFTSTRGHRVAPGLIPYSVNAPYWADGAHLERFMALPGQSQVEFHQGGTWTFPEGAVLVQSLALETNRAESSSRQWIETRVLLLQQNEWAGYTYQWNREQTDAELVGAGAEERDYIIHDARAPGGRREVTWQVPSRADCLTCHSRQAAFVLGLNTLQMNRDHAYGGITTNQIRALTAMGVLRAGKPTKTFQPATSPRLVDPYDAAAPVEDRIRSYLYVNCSHCHTDAGGGNSAMELRTTTKLEQMRILNVAPQHDTFELPDARLIAPGHPERSVLLHRLSQRGFGQMPPLSINTVDHEAVKLFEAWIRSLKID